VIGGDQAVILSEKGELWYGCFKEDGGCLWVVIFAGQLLADYLERIHEDSLQSFLALA